MPPLLHQRKNVEAAWRSFIVDGHLPDSIKPEIRRSWQRVRSEAVDPALRTCPRALAPDEVLARAESEGAMAVASRVASQFADRLASGGHVVAYFGADGVMLTIGGNPATRSRLEDVNFAPGACWAESAAGTNGPGTALVEARPVEVFASEHFVEAWHPWTCASVPVRFAGRVIGVVDITSPWDAWTPTLLLTAEALAHAIGSELDAHAAQQQSAILLQVARDALRARDDFLAVASHELKTPLTPLYLQLQKVERLLRHGAGVDPADLAAALQGADRHVGRVVKCVDDLLAMSRVVHEPLALVKEETDLAAAVRAVVERRRAELERRGCEIRMSIGAEVVGCWDRARIERAFEELLLNAMRFAPGRVDVEVHSVNEGARVRVRDHGPGIAPEDLDRIFLPFERAVSSLRAPGFGLGLHAARRTVEAHGGAIHVESALGQGSTFTLELPLSIGLH